MMKFDTNCFHRYTNISYEFKPYWFRFRYSPRFALIIVIASSWYLRFILSLNRHPRLTPIIGKRPMFLVLYAWILVYNVLKEYQFFNIYVAGVWYHTVDPARYGRPRPVFCWVFLIWVLEVNPYIWQLWSRLLLFVRSKKCVYFLLLGRWVLWGSKNVSTTSRSTHKWLLSSFVVAVILQLEFIVMSKH